MAAVTLHRRSASATASPSSPSSSSTLIFLAPIYWIASTAFKPRAVATSVPPTVFFTPEITPFIKLFTKRVQLKQARRPGGLRRRALVGAARSIDGGERVLKVGDDAAALAISQPLHQQPDRRDHLDLRSRSAWARSPPTASRASRSRARHDLLFFILSTRMLPPIVVAIPMFLMYRAVGLTTRISA